MTTLRPKIGLATFEGRPELTPDDAFLAVALQERGVAVVVQPWSGPFATWVGCDAVVIRSCWDYHLRLGSFLDWISALEGEGVRVCNRGSLIRWNASKSYLRELAGRGIPVVPTVWVDEGDCGPLRAVLEKSGWDAAVVKPAVSASAHGLWRTTLDSAERDESRYRELRRGGLVMVQPFLSEIEREGEWSLVFVGGRYSHAVVKRPKPGDFRVQDQHGGTREPALPDVAVIEAAARVANAAPEIPAYARIDGCLVEGKFLLMELELIEPELFLTTRSGAASLLADLLTRQAQPARESVRA